MTKINRDGFKIECKGHAGDKTTCAMLTALTVALVKNITERYGDTPEFELKPGYFVIDTRDLSIEANILIDAYVYSLKGLAESYPKHFECNL